MTTDLDALLSELMRADCVRPTSRRARSASELDQTHARVMNVLAHAARDLARRKNLSVDDAGLNDVARVALSRLSLQTVEGVLALDGTALVLAGRAVSKSLDVLALSALRQTIRLLQGHSPEDTEILQAAAEAALQGRLANDTPWLGEMRWPDLYETAVRYVKAQRSFGLETVLIQLPVTDRHLGYAARIGGVDRG